MKILFVSSYYVPYVSGLTIYAKNLAEELAKRKHEITIITNSHQPNLSQNEFLNGITVKRIKPWLRLSRGFFSPLLLLEFFKNVFKADVVVFHLPMPESFIFSPLTKFFFKKLILIYHAELNLPSWSFASLIIIKIVLINHIIAGLFADKIIGGSKEYVDFSPFLRHFKRKIVIIPPPVLIRAPNKKEAKKKKEQLGLSRDKIIGFAGRFAEEKGGDILIRSLPFVLRSFPNTKLVFAGEINLVYEDFYQRQRTLIDKFKDKIIFLGPIPPKEMSEFYAMCDVLALPSRAEGYPLVPIEAMLCGCPVVAFDIPGGRVPIKLTQMGKLVPFCSPHQYAGGIISVLKDGNKFIKPRIEIEKIFNLEGTLDRYEKIFKKS